MASMPTSARTSRERFAMAPRGYTMSEVDWALEQAAGEIDRLRARLAEVAAAAPPSHDDATR